MKLYCFFVSLRVTDFQLTIPFLRCIFKNGRPYAAIDRSAVADIRRRSLGIARQTGFRYVNREIGCERLFT